MNVCAKIYLFQEKAFETVNTLTRSGMANLISADHILHDNFNKSGWIIHANMPQTLNKLGVSLATVEKMKK